MVLGPERRARGARHEFSPVHVRGTRAPVSERRTERTSIQPLPSRAIWEAFTEKSLPPLEEMANGREAGSWERT